jgi:DivIVA domain-containing protein
MELTSQAINEAEFSMAKKGYDPDQVDEFLEKLAVAVDKQNEALAEARERATMAERRAAEAERRLAERPTPAAAPAPSPAPVVVAAPPEPVRPAGPSPTEISAAAEAELETLKRTLVLAQKTADATIREAEEEARRMIATAERDAEAAEAGTRARLLEEIAALDTGRATLQSDVAALERHLDEQRLRLRSSVTDLQRLLDDPGRLQPTPAPPASPLDLPPSATLAAAAPVAPPPDPAPALPAAAAAPPSAPAPAPAPAAFADAPSGDDDAWARYGTGDAPEDLGPPTQPILRLDDLEPRPASSDPSEVPAGDNDAYLDELRKAMLDDTGAPDFDDDDFDDERGSRSRFGRRR